MPVGVWGGVPVGMWGGVPMGVCEEELLLAWRECWV